MSHRHWCEVTGHEWTCSGSAIRLYENGPTPCLCIQHHTSMDDSDHSDCPIELIACLEHRREQIVAMGYDPDQLWPERQKSDKESGFFRDKDGNRTIGFCAWCSRDFYTIEEHDTHIANNAQECEVFRKRTHESNVPKLLDGLFDEASKNNPEEKDESVS